MGTNSRYLAASRLFATWVALTAVGCDDNDRTTICVGPGCPDYEPGDGGSGGTAGTGGVGGGGVGGGGTGGSLLEDAGVDGSAGTSTEPPPDGDVPEGGSEEPCEVAFVSPLPGDGGQLMLGPSDDADGESCGAQFATRVTVNTTGSTLNFFVNDNPFGPHTVIADTIGVDVPLGNRGATPNSLRVQAQMPDGRTCEATFNGDIFVDCDGPSCSITNPVPAQGDFLNASQDADDGVAGLQTSVTVQSELEHVGQDVRLLVGDGFLPDGVPLANVGGQSLATFADLTLVEGPHEVQAECRDGIGNVTLSPPVIWTVDLTPCQLTNVTVAGGANPILPGHDADSGVNGIQVLVTGEITGGDCQTVRVGECGESPAEVDVDGDTSFSVSVTLANATATYDVCADVVDAAGNESDPVQQTVQVRTDPPQVAIASPSDDARFNRLGTGGAIADGNAGTSSCEATVTVHCTEVGGQVELLVDNVVVDSETCVAQGSLPSPFTGIATFSVSLASQNDASTTLLSASHEIENLPAGVSAAIEVQADCEAPACSITSPDVSLDFLNAALDSSVSADFQATFAVQSEAVSSGQSVSLTFDADSGTTVTANLDGSGVATFSDVTLSEGLHSVEAECVDLAGNSATSVPETWTVDTLPCSSSLVVAGGVDPITTNHDLNLGAADLQLVAAGQTVGSGCVSARVGVCGSLSGSFTALESDGSFALGLTLPSVTAPASACVETLDLAGNVGSDSTSVNVRVDAPVVVITSPLDNADFNQGTGCSTTIEVTCSDDGEDVDLSIDGVATDSTLCTAGGASFNVNLTSKDDGATTEISVETTADGLTSAPESITVQADCNPPVVSITDPVCGGQLALAGDDVDSGTADLQYDVVVSNGGVPAVDLTITRGVTDTEITATGNATSTTFSAANLGGTGAITLTACATDPQGNEGCSAACAVTIAAEPSVSITSPTTGSTITTATTDCNTSAAGLQVTVTGTSDASDGSGVEVTVGSATPATTTVTSGAWSACASVVEGDNQTLTATVTHAQTSLEASATITVSVDITPSGAIAAPTFTVTGRRQGTGNLQWLSVLDSDSDPLAAYHVRCATTEIVDETGWNAATVVPNAITPAATAGVTETLALTEIKTGTTRFCVVRGEDDNANLSAMAQFLSGTVSNPFLTQQYSVVDDPNAAGSVARVSLDPIGDVNGDGIADFIHGATNRVAQVFFGQTTFAPSSTETPDIEITFGGGATNTAGFGSEVAGLGDINGDTLPDFAIGAPGGNAVFVFFGRSSNTWPATIDVDTTSGDGCEADLCIVGSGLGGTSNGLFGWDVHSANFDSSGPNDIVIAARTANTRGQVFILLGGTQLATSGTTITVQNATATPNVDGFVVNGPAASPNFGFSVGSVGTTVLIGANGSGTGGTQGAVFTLAAQSTPTAGSGLTTLASPTLVTVDTGTLANFGAAIRAVGDYNGDGFLDFAAGESFNSGGGRATLYPGSLSGFSSATELSFLNNFSPAVDDNYGTFIGAGSRPDLGVLGDLDGDGEAELLVGATAPDSGPADSRGSAQLFYGAVGAGARGRTVADMSYTSSLASGQVVPNYVGDINDDGFNDMAMLDSGTGTNVLFLLY